MRAFETIVAEARLLKPRGGWSVDAALTHLVAVEPKLKTWVCQSGLPSAFAAPAAVADDEGPTYFTSLAKTLTFQQVSIAAGKSIFAKMLDALGCTVTELTPERIRDAAFGVIVVDGKQKQTINGVSCGLSGAKARYLRSLSAHFLAPDKLLNVDLQALPDEEVYRKLIAIDGFGAWSVHMFLLFKLQRPNVFAVGDLGVKKGIAKLHGLSDAQWKKMKEPQFLELVQHWAPYASLATALMWSADKVRLDGADTGSAGGGLGLAPPAVRTPPASKKRAAADGADPEEPVTTGETKRKRRAGEGSR